MSLVVVDTNILFSALRAKDSLTRKKLLTSLEHMFYTPNFLITELFKHRDRILRKSSAREEEVYEFLNKILHKVHFVNEEAIGTGNYIQAYRLCKEVDESDSPFVALALELNAKLWTRDQPLVDTLTRKGFSSFLTRGVQFENRFSIDIRCV